MVETRGVWGIEIGQAGLKAVRLKYAEAAGQVLAVAFDYVPHPKILSQPDAIPDELINQAIEKFLSRNEVKGDAVCISVPGQTALTRFIQLPPVESSKVAQIVEYEARQQIPFPLDEVCWKWQRLGSGVEESGYMLEAEVGLFAMKRDQVMQHLKPFLDHQVEVDQVQIAPLALYNFLSYDRLGIRPGDDTPASDEHTIVLDMGADNTTLMVSNGHKIWIRNVPIGGNHFTRALTKEMKLTFAKAEHLKLNATKAPDPRAVFQALRPVFNQYVAEIQRSIGYFSSVNRNAKIGKVLGVGNGFKLAGLQKFLQQNLQYEVERVDEFQAIVGDTVLNAKLFDENILSFAVPYGLALQGLGLTRIEVDLLPNEIRVERMIRRKKPWAVLTAASILVGFALSATGYAHVAASVDGKAQATPTGPTWDDAITASKSFKDFASGQKRNYEQTKAAYAAQSKKNELLVRSEEGRVQWLKLYKAIVESLPRDPPDTYQPNQIKLKNRIKVYSITTEKLDDVAVWFDQIPDSRKGFLKEEDKAKENAPKGEGYIVTLQLIHHHEEKDSDGKLINYGTNWVRKTLIKNLQKWYVEHQHPEPTGKVYVRGIGITHPLVTKEARVQHFDFYLDLNKRRIQGRLKEGVGDGGGVGNVAPMPKNVAKQGKNGESNAIQIPLTKLTVQFVWQPLPPEKQAVFNALYEFFTSTNADGGKGWTSANARKFLDENEAKFHLKERGFVFSDALYQEFVKKHFAAAAKKPAAKQ